TIPSTRTAAANQPASLFFRAARLIGSAKYHSKRRARSSNTTSIRKHRPRDEREVRGTLRETTHIPREPLFAVADQRFDAVTLAREAELLGALNPEEQMELERVVRDGRVRVLPDAIDHAPVVRAEDRSKTCHGRREHLCGEPEIVRINVALPRIRD